MRGAYSEQADQDQLALERALIRQGMHPREAERTAAKNTLNYRQARAREGTPRDAEGRPLLSEDEAAFDAQMAMAMGQDVSYGNGAEVDNLEAAGTPIVMERELVPGSSEAVLAAREAEAARDWEERGKYYGDPDPTARGMAPTYHPETGEVGYSVAYPMPNADGEIPTGAPGRPGQRPDLRRPVIDTATGQPIPGSHKYDKQLRDGPDGLVEVYAPSPEFKAELQEREARNRTRRLATRAGYDPVKAAEMATSDTPVNLDQLRAMGDARRDAEKAERQQAVIRRAQARYNPMEYLNRDDVNEWQRMVAADSMLRRGYRGATPLDVEGAHNKQLTELGLRVAQGQGFQQLTPEQRQLVEIKAAEAERGVPAEERAAKYRDAPAVHPSEVDMVDSYVSDMYSGQSNWALGGTITSFTAEEQQATVDWLVNEKGYKPDKARQIVDGIARKRHAQSWWGNFE